MRSQVFLGFLSILFSGSNAFSQTSGYYGYAPTPSGDPASVPSSSYYSSMPQTNAQEVESAPSEMSDSSPESSDDEGGVTGEPCTTNPSDVAEQAERNGQLCHLIDPLVPPTVAFIHVWEKKEKTYKSLLNEYHVTLPIPHEDKEQWDVFFDSLEDSVPGMLSSITEIDDSDRCPKDYYPASLDFVLSTEEFQVGTTVTFFFRFYKRPKGFSNTWEYKPFWLGAKPNWPWKPTNGSFWLTVNVVQTTKVKKVATLCARKLQLPGLDIIPKLPQ